VRPRTVLDAVERREQSLAPDGDRISAVQPIALRYTESSISNTYIETNKNSWRAIQSKLQLNITISASGRTSTAAFISGTHINSNITY
jgi:hypothetical protein